jgi:hypothetical protein
MHWQILIKKFLLLAQFTKKFSFVENHEFVQVIEGTCLLFRGIYTKHVMFLLATEGSCLFSGYGALRQ